MKAFLLFSLFTLISCSVPKSLIIQNYNENENERIRWGSVSSQGENYGFYGQEFVFDKLQNLKSISVFIYDHPDHDETKSTINFSIWDFMERPNKELLVSNKIQIQENEVGNWKTYKLDKPFKIKKGKYLIAVGQTKKQGFVAFGNQSKKEGYQSKSWIKAPFGIFSKGEKWTSMDELMKNINPNITQEQLNTFDKSCVMMKLELN